MGEMDLNKVSRTFDPITLAGVTLRNRIAMAPLTRQMADEDGTPNDEMAAYYARRARGGVSLVITEGTFFNDELGCVTYLRQPGIATEKHIEGWRKTVDAVHAAGAKIILQLMHAGRVADPRTLHEGESGVTASAGQSEGWVLYTDNDYEQKIRGVANDWPVVTFPPAREMTEAEIHRVADGFAEGAARAIEAGFDGVEVHGANGYLLWQFINPKVNRRTDQWGGSPENNTRFARLVCERVREAIGKDKILTLRLSQDGVDDFLGAWPGASYAEAVGKSLASCDIDALHWASFDWSDHRQTDGPSAPMPEILRSSSGKPMIVNGGVADLADSEAALKSAGDMVAVGRPLFGHPDWPHIIRSGDTYDWLRFDRKYVVKPPYDYDIAYPAELPRDDWTPDLSVRRRPGWMG